MTIKIEEATRKQVAEFLPLALEKAFKSYQDYVNAANLPDEGGADIYGKESGSKPDISRDKKFIDHHNACKVALAHVQLLLKLAEQTDVKLPDGEMKANLELALNALSDDKFRNCRKIGEER